MQTTTRAMQPLAGIGWLKNAVNLGRHNPKAIFGGAALMLVALFALVVVMLGVQLLLRPGPAAAMVLSLGMLLAVLALMPMLMAGYLRLLDAVENQRPARARDVFAGFGDLAVSLRMIGFFVLLAVLQNALLLLVLTLFAGDVVGWYTTTMQSAMAGGAAAPATGLPDGLGIAAALMAVLGLLVYAVQSIGLCQIALRGRGVFGAIGDGTVGAVKNVVPLLVFVLVCVLAGLVLALGLGLVVLLVGVLGKLVGMWLAVVLAVPLYFALLLVIYVVMFGVMYYLWRDVCGGTDAVEMPAGALTA